MAKIFGWDPTEMRKREDAFAAAVDKKITTLGAKAVQLFKSQRVVTAAGTPVPPVDLGEMAALTGMWKGYVSAELMPMLSDVYLESAGVIWQGIEEAFDDFTPDAVSDVFAEEYLASASNRLVGIGDNVWLKVREELLTGFSLGESTTALANRIETAAQVSQARANVIARTEANMAANAGSFQQVLVSGLTGTKEWLDTNDERTRCTHRAAGGQTVDILTPFTLGGGDCGEGLAYLMMPGDVTAPPSEIIQCRCSVAFDLSLEEESVVTAAGEVNMGGMIALMPTADDANALALDVDGAEPASELHTTLLFLGEASEWGTANRDLLVRVVTEIAAKYTSIGTETFSVNIFNPSTDDFDTAVVLGVRGTDMLVALHKAIAGNVTDVFDDEVPAQHTPWVPHITLAYSDEMNVVKQAMKKLGPVVFDRVRVVFAGQITDIPLGAEVMTAAGDHWDESKVKRDHEGKFAKKSLDKADIWSKLKNDVYEQDYVIATGHAHGKNVRLVAHPQEGEIIEQYQTPTGDWLESDYWITAKAFQDADLPGYDTVNEPSVPFSDNQDEVDFDFSDDSAKSMIDLTPTIDDQNPLLDELITDTTYDAFKVGMPDTPTNLWSSLDGEKVSHGEVVKEGTSSDGHPLQIVAGYGPNGEPFLQEQETINGTVVVGRTWHTSEEFDSADLSEYPQLLKVTMMTIVDDDADVIIPPGTTLYTGGPLKNGDRDKIWSDVQKGLYADGDIIAQSKDGSWQLVVRATPDGTMYTQQETKIGDAWQVYAIYFSQKSWNKAALTKFGINKSGEVSATKKPFSKPAVKGDVIPDQTTTVELWDQVKSGMFKEGDVLTYSNDEEGITHALMVKKNTIHGGFAIIDKKQTTGVDPLDLDTWSTYDIYYDGAAFDELVGDHYQLVKTEPATVIDPAPSLPLPPPAPSAAPKKVAKLTNAIIYGKYQDGEVIATDGKGFFRVVYKNNKIHIQTQSADGTWKGIGYGKAEAYKKLQGADAGSGWFLGDVTPSPVVAPSKGAKIDALTPELLAGKYANGEVIATYTGDGIDIPMQLVYEDGKFKQVADTGSGVMKSYNVWDDPAKVLDFFTDFHGTTGPWVVGDKAPTPSIDTSNPLFKHLKKGNFSDGQIVASYSPSTVPHPLYVRLVFKNGKFVKQIRASDLTTDWDDKEEFNTAEEAFTEMNAGAGSGGTWLPGDKLPMVSKQPKSKTAKPYTGPGLGGFASPNPPKVTPPDSGTPFTPVIPNYGGAQTSVQAPPDTHLGLWQKLEAGGFSEGEVVSTFDTGAWNHRLIVKKENGKLVFVHDKDNKSGNVIVVDTYTTQDDFLTAYLSDFHDKSGNPLVTTSPQPKTMAPPTSAPSGASASSVSSIQQGQIKTFFKNESVKWHTDASTMLEAAVSFQQKHPELTLGQILAVMDTSTKTKTSDAPFTDKIKKFLNTTKGKQQAKMFGLPADAMVSGGTTSGTSTPGTSAPLGPLVPVPGITPSLAGHGIYEPGSHSPKAPPGGYQHATPQLMLKLQKESHSVYGAWTPAQIKALQTYTGSSTSMNGCLRKPQFCTPHVKKQVQDAADAMRPLTVGIRTRRGTGFAGFPGAEEIKNSKGIKAAVEYIVQQQGRLLREPGFLSTAAGGGFGGNLQWIVDIPPGVPLAYVEGITLVKGEKEVLLPPGLKYRIKEVHAGSGGFGQTTITLEVVYP